MKGVNVAFHAVHFRCISISISIFQEATVTLMATNVFVDKDVIGDAVSIYQGVDMDMSAASHVSSFTTDSVNFSSFSPFLCKAGQFVSCKTCMDFKVCVWCLCWC
jgi:hypothetical protein